MDNEIFRTIVKQTSTYILFENILARASLRALSGQIFSGGAPFLPAAMEDIRSLGEWSYMVLDLRRGTREVLRVRSGLPLPGTPLYVYVWGPRISLNNVPATKGLARPTTAVPGKQDHLLRRSPRPRLQPTGGHPPP